MALGKDQKFDFGYAIFEATIRPTAGGVRWEVGDWSGGQEIGLGWGHGAGKEAPYIAV